MQNPSLSVIRCVFRSAVLLSLVCGAALTLSGQTWNEVGDAGEFPDTAQWTAGTGALTQIKGQCPGGDHDMFVIAVTDAAHFKAQVTQGGDTKLGLFTLDGTGIVMNDDTRVPNSPLSIVDFTQNGIPLSNGTYVLALLNAGQMWANEAGRIWNNQGPNGEWDDQRSPDGPGAPGPVTEYVGNVDAGNSSDPFTITLGGAGFARQGQPPQVDVSPADVAANENQAVVFSVMVSGSQPFSFQWQASTDNGATFSPIAGATNATYTLVSVHPSSDHQKKVRVVVTNPIGSATSAAATLTVTPDTTAPSASYARTLGHPSAILVGFSEGVDATTATTAANYSLAGVTFTNVTLVGPSTVLLRASSPVGTGSLTVSGVLDQADARNVLAPNPTSLPLDANVHGVVMRKYDGIPRTTIDDLTGSPAFPGTPDLTQILATTETPSNMDDNYGAVLVGYVVPPTTGEYTFYICSDDNGELLLSNDENPNGAFLIATEPGYDTPRNWLSKPDLQSAPQSLVAGRRYYLEARMKEGGGEDNLAVTWVKPGETLQPNQPPIDTPYLIPFGSVAGGNPAVTGQPQDVTVTAGTIVRLQATVVGAPPLAYQWFKDGVPIPGAVQPLYSLRTIRTSGGVYRLGVTNVFGATSSSNAVLTVQTVPGVWLEEGDAADTLATAQVTVGSGALTNIQGTIPDGWDNDVYKIRVTDYAHFSAIVTAPEGGNSKLALFDADGMGVVYNDDQSDFSSLSAIDYATSRRPVANGLFYLGICSQEKYFGTLVGVEAVSIWSPDTPTAQQLPDGPGKDHPFTGFGGYGGSLANYNIVLTGAGFADSGTPQAVSLKVQMASGKVVVSWPAEAALVLQQTEQLPATVWTPTTATPVVAGTEKQVTITPSGKAVFYRLSQP
jgi:hypothetical protein